MVRLINKWVRSKERKRRRRSVGRETRTVTKQLHVSLNLKKESKQLQHWSDRGVRLCQHLCIKYECVCVCVYQQDWMYLCAVTERDDRNCGEPWEVTGSVASWEVGSNRVQCWASWPRNIFKITLSHTCTHAQDNERFQNFASWGHNACSALKRCLKPWANTDTHEHYTHTVDELIFECGLFICLPRMEIKQGGTKKTPDTVNPLMCERKCVGACMHLRVYVHMLRVHVTGSCPSAW